MVCVIKIDTLPFLVAPSQYSSRLDVSPGSWPLQNPPHRNCIHFWISTCGSGISCVGLDPIVSLLCSYRLCSKTLEYLDKI